MQITGILRQKVEIETNPKELVKALFLHYFQTDNYNIIVEKDNKLYYEIDVSVHGSPVYEYRKFTSDPKKIEIFHALIKLLDNI